MRRFACESLWLFIDCQMIAIVFSLFSIILLNASYIVQQRSKNLDSKSWMSFRANLFVFYWTDDFAGSWIFSENFRGYFAARVPAHLAVVPSWTTSGTLRSQFFARNYSLKKWIDKYGFCNVYIHTINMSWLKEREWTSVCLVVFYRIIEKLQKNDNRLYNSSCWTRLSKTYWEYWKMTDFIECPSENA